MKYKTVGPRFMGYFALGLFYFLITTVVIASAYHRPILWLTVLAVLDLALVILSFVAASRWRRKARLTCRERVAL